MTHLRGSCHPLELVPSPKPSILAAPVVADVELTDGTRKWYKDGQLDRVEFWLV